MTRKLIKNNIVMTIQTKTISYKNKKIVSKLIYPAYLRKTTDLEKAQDIANRFLEELIDLIIGDDTQIKEISLIYKEEE